MSNDIISIANEIAAEKENIRLAIIAQGVNCEETTPLDEYPGKIASINAVTTVPDGVWSDDNITEETANYTVPAGTGIIGGRLFDKNRSTLESLDLNSVIAVGSNTCYDCTSLSSLTGINVKYIGENAFDNCYNLSNLVSSSLEYIEERAFTHCYNVTTGLQTINCPNVEYVGIEAFSENQLLQSVSLPACTELGAGAFRYAGNQIFTTSQINITYNLPNVEKIGYEGIYDNNGLTSISLPKVKDLGIRCFYSCDNLATVSAPLCETIKDTCFCNTALTTFTAPNVKSVGISAFEGSTTNTLANINGTNQCNLPECDYVGDLAFYNNKKFTSLTLKDGCVIGARAFEVDNQNNSTMVDANIKPIYIGYQAFGRRFIPQNIDFSLCTTIGHSAFNTNPSDTSATTITYLSQGLDFSSMQTFYLNGYMYSSTDNYNGIFCSLGSTSQKVKVWMPKTAVTNGTTGHIFKRCALDLYTDAASSSELGVNSRLQNNSTITFHYSATHEDFLNA